MFIYCIYHIQYIITSLCQKDVWVIIMGIKCHVFQLPINLSKSRTTGKCHPYSSSEPKLGWISLLKLRGFQICHPTHGIQNLSEKFIHIISNFYPRPLFISVTMSLSLCPIMSLCHLITIMSLCNLCLSSTPIMSITN